jgi:hypothetical protein
MDTSAHAARYEERRQDMPSDNDNAAEQEEQVRDADLRELHQDDHNANLHSERGNWMLRESVQRFGSREAGTVDKHGRIVGGNHRHEIYGELDMEEVQVVKGDPNKPIFIQYDDLDLEDPSNPAQEISVALNRAAQTSITFDGAALAEKQEAGIDLSRWFHEDEAVELGFTLDNHSGYGEYEGSDGFFDASQLPDAAGAGEDARSFMLYVTFRTREEFLYALRLLTYGDRDEELAPLVRIAVIDGSEWLERWQSSMTEAEYEVQSAA